MSVMLSLISWFLLVMAAGGGLHTNSATAEVTIATNSAAVTAYWRTMLPNTLMPSAILELLPPPADSGAIKLVEASTSHDVKKNNGNRGSSTKAKDQKSNGNGGPSNKAEDQKNNGKWGSSTINDVEKINRKWGPSTKAEDEKSNRNWAWGSSTKAEDLNHNGESHVDQGKGVWGPSTTNNVEKINNGNWDPSTKAGDEKGNRNWAWGSSTKAEDLNHNGESHVDQGKGVWGPSTTNNVEKINNGNWDPSTKAGDEKGNRNWAWGSSTKAEDLNHNGESHVDQDNHKHGTMSNMVFLEEALKPGSTISCYIQPSATSGAPLLQRDVADSIPMSTVNFTDIMTMFAPVSNDMAANIWSTLDDCEHPRAIKGETKACVTSVESMVEFVAFVLGVSTYNLRAFSSQDVPVEGVMTGRGYKVADATRVSEAGDTMTCHGGRFPFAMFMCHAVNPTRVYSVTLEGEDVDVDGARQRIEVLAVCHLDTSDFHPDKMPVHVKPGDAPLCHFISRDSILWAPASGHIAA